MKSIRIVFATGVVVLGSMLAMPRQAEAAIVSLFADPACIVTASGGAQAFFNLRTSIATLGHWANGFDGFAAADWTAAMTNADALAIPRGDTVQCSLNPIDTQLSAQTLNDIRDYVANGGRLLVHGDQGQGVALINAAFGFTLTRAFGGGGPTNLDPGAAVGTEFEGGPGSLAGLLGDNLVTGTLPVGSHELYINIALTGDSPTVALIPYGDGAIAFIGNTWANMHLQTAPVRSDWEDVLDRAITGVLATDEPGLPSYSLNAIDLEDLSGNSQGFSFEASHDFVVTGLGHYDKLEDGLTDPHQVGLFGATGNLLLDATVAAGTVGELIDGYRYSQFEPMTLPAGEYTLSTLLSFGDAQPLVHVNSLGAFAAQDGIQPVVGWIGSGGGVFEYPTLNGHPYLRFAPNLLTRPSRIGSLLYTLDATDDFDLSGNSQGFAFETDRDLVITGLGHYDLDGDGLADPHPVGVFDLNGNLLVWTPVEAGTAGLLRNDYRFTEVEPFALPAGQYVLGTLLSFADAQPYTNIRACEIIT